MPSDQAPSSLYQCCGFEFFQSRIPDPGSKRFPDTGSAPCIKNLSILNRKIVSKLSEIWSGMFILEPHLDFLPIPDPGVKKTPDPGYGSATLLYFYSYLIKDKSQNLIYQLPYVRYHICLFFDKHQINPLVLNFFSFLIFFFGGPECVGHSFAYVAHFELSKDVWIQCGLETLVHKYLQWYGR